jgi:hypothetical protein
MNPLTDNTADADQHQPVTALSDAVRVAQLWWCVATERSL